jgi:hypothetical protein
MRSAEGGKDSPTEAISASCSSASSGFSKSVLLFFMVALRRAPTMGHSKRKARYLLPPTVTVWTGQYVLGFNPPQVAGSLDSTPIAQMGKLGTGKAISLCFKGSTQESSPSEFVFSATISPLVYFYEDLCILEGRGFEHLQSRCSTA